MSKMGFKFKKLVVCLTAASLVLTNLNMITFAREADQLVAKGIRYNQKQVNVGGKNCNLSIISSDLNDPDVNIIFSKAGDKVKKYDTLTNQIKREVQKGNNIIGGINADMFNMSNGFSSGPQINNGMIITGHNSMQEQNRYPVFGIDKSKRPFIDYIHFNGKISVLNDDNTPSGRETSVDNVNRDNYSNQLVLNTIDLNEYKKVDMKNNTSTGVLVVVKGITNNLPLGKDLDGQVEMVYAGLSSIKIPNDGVVLAAAGPKASWVKANIKKGSKIRINLNYDREIQEAIGVYTYIVKDGAALTPQEMIANGCRSDLAYARKARTALGITADNRVIAIVAELGRGSKGITLEEMGRYMQSQGVITAVGLDGGGSSQMNVKLFGDQNLTIVNRPSDGAERRLTNAILFSSTAPKSNEIAAIFPVYKNIILYKNSLYKVRLRGVDTYNNPMDLSYGSFSWKTAGNIGTVDENGLITAAPSPGVGSVAAYYGSIYGGASVTVVDTLGSIDITGGSSINLKPGESKQFSLTAKSAKKENVVISNNAATWTLTGNIGSIDENGLYTSNGNIGAGFLTVSAGGRTDSMVINVSNSGSIKLDTAPPVFGKFDSNSTFYSQNGDCNIYINVKDDDSGINPTSIKAKIDGVDSEASYSEKDSSVIVKAKNISEGMHAVEVNLSDKKGNAAQTFINTFNVLELSKDTVKPEIGLITPSDTIYTPNPRIFVQVRDEQSGINPSEVSIALDGKTLTSYYSRDWKGAYALVGSISQGSHSIDINVKDMAGNASQSKGYFTYVPFKGPMDVNNFSFSATSDVIGSILGEDVGDAISKDNSSLVLVNGATDNGYIYQWNKLYTNSDIKNKDIALGAGENDGIVPISTYSFDYGNSFFIALDSSMGGISEVDSSQFDYLKRVLETNTKNNVFIFTHSSTRDVFGTYGSMTQEDSKRFEDILSNYKKSNPSKNVNVIFGHAHGIKSWESNGVVYTCTGNASTKSLVKPENGGFLAYTKFNVAGNKITKEYIPVLEKIFIYDKGSLSNKIEMIRGTKKSLVAYGSFSPLCSKALVPMTPFGEVKINWTSSNPDVLVVDWRGNLVAKGTGTATVTAEISGKSSSTIVDVVDEAKVNPSKVLVSPSNIELKPGQSKKLDVTAFTIYGDAFKVDNKLVQWDFDQSIGSIKDGVFTAAKDISEDIISEVKAIYNGKIGKVIIKIKKIIK